MSAQVVSPKRTDVNWTDAVNEAGYQVDYSTDSGTTWQSLAHAGQNVTQASDLSVVAGQNRLYRVTALDANNQPLMVNTTVVRGQSGTVTTPALPVVKSPSKDRLSFERVANADGATRSGECRSLNFDQIGNLRSVWQAGQTTTCNSNRLNQLTSRSGSKSIVVEGHANADQHLLVRLALEDGTGSTWVPAARDGDHYCAVLSNPNAYAQQVRVEIGEAGFNVQGGAEITTIETRSVQVRPKAENFIYDLRGNLQQDGTRNYTFDLADRLIQVQTNLQGVDAQTTAQFAYDFMGRRIARTISLGGQTIEATKFVYDGQLPLAEVDGNNQLVRSYAWSPGAQAVGGIGALQSITIYQDPQGVALSSPKRFLVVSDDKGNVSALVSADTNQVVVSYRYGPYGEVLEKASDGSDDGELALASNKFLWQTKYYEEAAEAYDFGYRWLQVATGRWMSRDPLAEEGGLNLYAYCDGDAVNRNDAWGLDFIETDKDGKVWYVGESIGWWYKLFGAGGRTASTTNRMVIGTRSGDTLTFNDGSSMYYSNFQSFYTCRFTGELAFKPFAKEVEGAIAEAEKVRAKAAANRGYDQKQVAKYWMLGLFPAQGREFYFGPLALVQATGEVVGGRVAGVGHAVAHPVDTAVGIGHGVANEADAYSFMYQKYDGGWTGFSAASGRLIGMNNFVEVGYGQDLQTGDVLKKDAAEHIGAGFDRISTTATVAVGGVGVVKGGASWVMRMNAVEKAPTFVFWSGRGMKEAASQFAKTNGGIVLEETPVGKMLEQTLKGVPWKEARPVWVEASKDMAKAATGEVHVFQNASGLSPFSVWGEAEYGLIMKNPRVPKIIYHIVRPKP